MKKQDKIKDFSDVFCKQRSRVLLGALTFGLFISSVQAGTMVGQYPQQLPFQPYPYNGMPTNGMPTNGMPTNGMINTGVMGQTPTLQSQTTFKDEILQVINKHLNKSAADIQRKVVEDVRLDEAVLCISRNNGIYYLLNTYSPYDGQVTNQNYIGIYADFFSKSDAALQKLNMNASPMDPVTLPQTPISAPFQLASSTGVQSFSGLISVIDKDHMCVARIPVISSAAGAAATTANSTFQTAVATTVQTMISQGKSAATVQESVISEISVNDAVVCLTSLSDGSYFRIHSKPSNNGLVTNADEITSFNTFMKTARAALQTANPSIPQTTLVTLAPNQLNRPSSLIAQPYTIVSNGVSQNFVANIGVIDYNTICFARTLGIATPVAAPVATPDTTVTTTAPAA